MYAWAPFDQDSPESEILAQSGKEDTQVESLGIPWDFQHKVLPRF